WGMPGKELELARSFGARIGIQVGTAEGARRAIGLGADFLICQGVEAGGHVQSSIPLERLLERVLPVAPTTPVVAAGGLVDAQDVARVLHLGASAAMLGTRFVATQESRAHPRYKQLLVESSETALTICFDGGWPFAQHRVLRNQALEEWEAAGCPPPGRRPGEGEAVAKGIARYEDTAPRVGMAGDFDRMCLYAGAGVGKIRDIPAAPEVVAGLVNGAS
ncbi:MAG TPA: nitronate monooxygenase, partial [Fimbriimonadaceae bacterium]|nr:nitronate monooxygenase [Fimbriimonadaceae bacterium]